MPKEVVDAAVQLALEDPEAFRASHGYRRAIRWQLLVRGEELDPRAVLAVAYESWTGTAVAPDDGPRRLTGGQLQKAFAAHGYEVIDAAPQFGHIPGYPVGCTFANRQEASMAGVHRNPQRGIMGSNDGAESIVLSGGYEDDDDQGDVVIYTGEGGNDIATGTQVADQDWSGGNHGLQVSCDHGLPVRVLRGASEERGPEVGYRYDGLYKVARYWRERGRSGFQICRFKMVAMDSGSVSDARLEDGDVEGGKGVDRRQAIVHQQVRRTELSRQVKRLYDYTCQACGERLETSGGPYAEGAHIKPVGRPHDGPDALSNMLCLCANCHVRFDKGGFVISEDHQIEDLVGGDLQGRKLHAAPGHMVSPECLAYHRAMWLT